MLKPYLIYLITPFVFIVLAVLGKFMIDMGYAILGSALVFIALFSGKYLIEYANLLLAKGNKDDS